MKRSFRLFARLRIAYAAVALLMTGGLDASVDAQPYQPAQRLMASDANARDGFGRAVAVSTGRALIGAYGDDHVGDYAGAVYALDHDAQAGQWVEVQKLTASDAESGDLFGWAVAISGDVAVIGANGAEGSAGAAYVFERDGQTGAWSEIQKLTASDAASEDLFGSAVSISGDVIVVGAEYDDDGGPYSGSAYVFERDAQSGTWAEAQKLTASDAAASDVFGKAVVVNGDEAFVGAYHDDHSTLNDGSVYYFVRDGETGGWVETQKIVASDPVFDAKFGISLSVSGDLLLVGAEGDHEADFSAGAAYVFERDGGSGLWVEAQKLTASNAAEFDYFGRSVSISPDVVLIGAYSTGVGTGSAYVFTCDPRTEAWGEVQELSPIDDVQSEYFGIAVAASGPFALVGSHRGGGGTGSTVAGAAYAFERPAGVSVIASGDAAVAQGGVLSVLVTVQNLTGAPVSARLVLAASGPGGQAVTRRLAAGTLPAGATVTRTFRVGVGNAPVGTWEVAVRVEDEGGQPLGSDAFTVEVTPASAVTGAPFAAIEEVEAAAVAPAAPAMASVVGPNPFRDRTALALTLPESADVRLTLHDALGREVAVLASGRYAAGRHVVPVEAGGLPSGVYAWRLASADAVATGRVTLAR